MLLLLPTKFEEIRQSILVDAGNSDAEQLFGSVAPRTYGHIEFNVEGAAHFGQFDYGAG